MALKQNYYKLWFESFTLKNISGHRNNVQLKISIDQIIPNEIYIECESRSASPKELLTECSRSFFNEYPVGTKFLLKAKLTDREGGSLFFYSYPGWKPFEIVIPK